MIRCKTHILSLSLLGLIAACGSAPEYDAGLEARQPREARVKITAALDVSSMVDQSLVDRLVIEDIQVNLADVRLLGADPRIPAGGLPLLNQNQIVRLGGNFESALELPFPQHFVRQDDLAVYLRVDKAEALEWSSVVISGRLYSEALDFSSLKYLTAEAQDPDGDPCRDGAQDPDGDPAKCAKKNGLAAAATMARQSVEFELRGEDVADLVATLDQDAELDVVVGIPAARWFTPEMVKELDEALGDLPEGDLEQKGQASQGEVVVIEPGQREASDQAASKRKRLEAHEEGYFVGHPDHLQDRNIRRP